MSKNKKMTLKPITDSKIAKYSIGKKDFQCQVYSSVKIDRLQALIETQQGIFDEVNNCYLSPRESRVLNNFIEAIYSIEGHGGFPDIEALYFDRVIVAVEYGMFEPHTDTIVVSVTLLMAISPIQYQFLVNFMSHFPALSDRLEIGYMDNESNSGVYIRFNNVSKEEAVKLIRSAVVLSRTGKMQ